MTRLFAIGADVIDRIAAKAPAWRADAAACHAALASDREQDPDLGVAAACLKEALDRDDAEGVAQAIRSLFRSATARSAD